MSVPTKSTIFNANKACQVDLVLNIYKCMTTLDNKLASMPSTIMDQEATGYFVPENGGFLPAVTPSTKAISMANGFPVGATEQASLPLFQLHNEARNGNTLQGLHNLLTSIWKLSDVGYATIFFQ